MDRPVTSKSRGICRYYTTPRGCFAGDDCKFLHGADEKLTPYDKAKCAGTMPGVCSVYLLSTVSPNPISGHCTRGDRCWFRHVLPKVVLDDERIQFNTDACCICLEKPTTQCIRQWRAPAGKSPDVVSSGTIKCCPLCRIPSRFVTPSAHFFPNGNPRKKETIDAYKASMARISCKYIYRTHRLRGANLPPARFDYDDPIEFLQHIFENPITNLHATLDVIRASLPALMERFGSSNESGSHALGDDEETVGNSIDPLELLTIGLYMTKRQYPFPLLRREIIYSLRQWNHSQNMRHYRRERHCFQNSVSLPNRPLCHPVTRYLLNPNLHVSRCDSTRQ
ncbi:hypothetical protein J3R82DRAFT_2417 [Butyriboletus roseoflavus]|nr:hypothetical protein J3R82DRAFT_2417 [Butyriboletus roseoflavus]